ncbi:MAG: ABC transporter permease [Bacillota bacterium]
MFWRMLRQSLSKGLTGKLLVVVTIAFGASLATAMLSVLLDVGDKINQELRSYGANLIIEPQMGTFALGTGSNGHTPWSDIQLIAESDLLKMKTIFWANNIVGFAPYLEVSAAVPGLDRQVAVHGTWFERTVKSPTGEEITTGTRMIKPWWEVNGKWPSDGDLSTVMVGVNLAGQLGIRPGDQLPMDFTTPDGVRREILSVQGIVSTGGEEDDKVIATMELVQDVLGRPGQAGGAVVSAITTPENELAKKAADDVRALTRKEYETWYCTAYVSSIAFQIEEAIPGVRAKPIRQVAESEGAILEKIQLLMLILTLAALISSALGVSSLMTTKVLERNKEIGLLKAVGAEDQGVLFLFMAETLILGILGGLLGYSMGLGFAQIIGRSVFGAFVPIRGLVAPIVLILSALVALGGSLSAMKFVIGLKPAEVLHGR